MTKVFSQETGLDFDRLAHYMAKGTKEVFVNAEDMAAFSEYLDRSPELTLGKDSAATEEKVSALLDMAEQNMTEFFNSLEVEESVAEKAQVVVQNFIKAMYKDPKVLVGLIRSVHHSNFLFQHSILTAIMAMLIADRANPGNQRMLKICGIGGLLHDIGMSQLPRDTIYPSGDLTAEQWAEMKRHPLFGMRMVEASSIVPEEVRLIIYQHHEEPKGNGYPNGLRSPQIFYPAKIVSVADSFASLITNRTYRNAFSPARALQIMKQEVGRYDRDLLAVLEKLVHSAHDNAA